MRAARGPRQQGIQDPELDRRLSLAVANARPVNATKPSAQLDGRNFKVTSSQFSIEYLDSFRLKVWLWLEGGQLGLWKPTQGKPFADSVWGEVGAARLASLLDIRLVPPVLGKRIRLSQLRVVP